MGRDTLIDFFHDLARARGEFLVHDDGFRSRTFSYARRRARGARIRRAPARAGLRKGDKVVFWSENRPEWIVAFWGCLLRGIVVVPIDYRASPDFLARVSRIVSAKLVLIGQDVPPLQDTAGAPVWRLHEIDWPDGTPPSRSRATTSRRSSSRRARPPSPKGVVITHRNVLANIVPVEREVLKYRKWGRPFFPLRFLNLLPLSHMFGQAMATFIPPMLPGVVVFMRGYNPVDIVDADQDAARLGARVGAEDPRRAARARLRARRAAPRARPTEGGGHEALAAALVAIPPRPSPLRLEVLGVRRRRRAARRRARSVLGRAGLRRHSGLRAHGDGADRHAESSVRDEEGIGRQGDRRRRGEDRAGRRDPRARRERDDAATSTPPRKPRARSRTAGSTPATSARSRADGQLFIRGRKKEMIVTPEGLNVFPEDVERVLNHIPGVRDSAVVGVATGGEERVHAVLVVDPGVDPDDVAREANAQLADHQKIRRALVWPEPELPRTEGTRKLKRAAIREWVKDGRGAAARPRPGGDALAALVAKYAGRADLSATTTIEELGLSSLERVELMVALEDTFQTRIDEGAFASARDLGQLRSLVEGASTSAAPPAEPVEFPAWNRSWPARAIRRVSLPTWILPLARLFAWIRVEGASICAIDTPVIFAANHQSHMDGPVIMAALPARWRYRVAPAMAKEFFKAHFFPEQYGARRVVHEQPQLLPRGALLQRVPAAAARGRRAPDAALHRRRARETASRC